MFGFVFYPLINFPILKLQVAPSKGATCDYFFNFSLLIPIFSRLSRSSVILSLTGKKSASFFSSNPSFAGFATFYIIVTSLFAFMTDVFVQRMIVTFNSVSAFSGIPFLAAVATVAAIPAATGVIAKYFFVCAFSAVATVTAITASAAITAITAE